MASIWNPWKGCTRKSEGCLNCYILCAAEKRGEVTGVVQRTDKFDVPTLKKNNGEYKTASGNLFFTCFSSDFLHEQADVWREEAWNIIRERNDCDFFFLTKRPERLMGCVPSDWGDGWDNVHMGVSCENQLRTQERLPVLMKLPIRHKSIVLAPMLERMDIERYLDGSVGVVCEGECASDARPLHFDWVMEIREQCIRQDTNFTFRQTGTFLVKENETLKIQKQYQHRKAREMEIDYQSSNK